MLYCLILCLIPHGQRVYFGNERITWQITCYTGVVHPSSLSEEYRVTVINRLRTYIYMHIFTNNK